MQNGRKMDGARSFGSRFAGEDFNMIEFLQKPQTIVRLLSLLFAIVVFGCISDQGFANDECVYNGNSGACHYGVGIGVIAFLACLIFLACDAQFNNISNADTRKWIVAADLVFSGVWTFLWFVGFCFLADMWRRTGTWNFNKHTINNARAAIAFSFFSIFTWGYLTAVALSRYRQGTTDFDYGGNNFPNEGGAPYASVPTPAERGDPAYQPKPFSNPQGQQQPVPTEYNVPY